MTVASVTKVTNDKGDNEKILGAVHISTGIWLTVEENSKKTSARRDRILSFFFHNLLFPHKQNIWDFITLS